MRATAGPASHRKVPPGAISAVPFIEFQQRLYRLREGENLVGSDAQANIRLSELRANCGVTISVGELGTFAWPARGTASVAINDRPLGDEPLPLFNGDRLSLNGALLVYVDDGGEPTVKLDAPIPAAVAKTVVEAETLAGSVEPGLLRRQTPPEPKNRVVAVLRRLDNNQCYIIERAGFRIGREKRCDLIIPDRKISRLHAEVTFARGAHLLRDLGRTATRVNGRKISEPHKLQVGDKIQIGKYEFVFLRRSADAEDIVQASEITPVRSAVPDSITLGQGAVGSRGFTWLILLLGTALAALLVLGV